MSPGANLASNSASSISKATFLTLKSVLFMPHGVLQSQLAFCRKKHTGFLELTWLLAGCVQTSGASDCFTFCSSIVWLYFNQQVLCHCVLLVISWTSVPFLSSNLFRSSSPDICKFQKIKEIPGQWHITSTYWWLAWPGRPLQIFFCFYLAEVDFQVSGATQLGMLRCRRLGKINQYTVFRHG